MSVPATDRNGIPKFRVTQICASKQWISQKYSPKKLSLLTSILLESSQILWQSWTQLHCLGKAFKSYPVYVVNTKAWSRIQVLFVRTVFAFECKCQFRECSTGENYKPRLSWPVYQGQICKVFLTRPGLFCTLFCNCDVWNISILCKALISNLSKCYPAWLTWHKFRSLNERWGILLTWSQGELHTWNVILSRMSWKFWHFLNWMAWSYIFEAC